MSDNNYNYLSQSCYKEVVNVSVDRVYDACSDKDCFEDLQVYFTDCVQPLINQAISAPDIHKRLTDEFALNSRPLTLEQCAEQDRDERAKWAEYVKIAKIEPQ